MQSLFEAGDVLRRFVRYAGNRVGVIEQLLRTARKRKAWPLGEKTVRMAAIFFFVAIRLSGICRAAVVDDLKDLSFNNSSYSVEISATLMFEVMGRRGLAPQPKYDERACEDGETRHRKQIIPVA